MASSTPDSTIRSPSYFTPTVTLLDWWLVKTDTDANGNPKTSLGVSGTTSYPNQAMRVFLSAPIAERLGDFTVETSDGVCLVLQSFINSQRTIDNGFSSQVAKSFAIGFPKDWQLYAEKCCCEASTTGRENPTRDSNSFPDIQSASPKATRTIHDEVPNIPPSVTIQTKSKVNHSGKSPTHSKVRASVNTGASPDAARTMHDEVPNSRLGITIQSRSKVNQSVKSPNHPKVRASVNTDASPEAARTIPDEVPNIPPAITIQTRSKVNQTVKSPTHSKVRASVNTSAGTRSGMKEKRMGACQSKTGDKNLNISNHGCKLRAGSVPYQSTEELQEQSSDPKRGNKFRNLTPKAAVGADAKEKRATEKKSKLKRKSSDAKQPMTPENKTKRKIKFDEQATPPRPRQDTAAKCIVSPESLSVGRSRSGRILLPVLEFWRNQIPVYDLDRNVTGIWEDRTLPVPERGGGRSESRKKRKL